MDLKNYTEIISLIGTGPEQDLWAGALILIIRDKGWLETSEGRALFGMCADILRGSDWFKALFPGQPDQETRDRLKKASELIEDFYEEFVYVEEHKMLSYQEVIGIIKARDLEHSHIDTP